MLFPEHFKVDMMLCPCFLHPFYNGLFQSHQLCYIISIEHIDTSFRIGLLAYTLKDLCFMLYILFYSKSSGAFSPELYPNIYYRT